MHEEARRALWRAVNAGEEDAVRAALADNSGLATAYETFDYQPTTVMTMLHVAASRDHIQIMQHLLAAGADPSALAPPGKGKMTPLHCAGRGNGLAVKTLLDAGADPNACANRGPTPLYSAAFNGNLEGCRLLLARGAHPDGKPSSALPLFAAAMESKVAIIELLLGAGATLHPKDSKKDTALHHAARQGDVAVNRFLLERGLNPDQPNKKGETPRRLIPENTLGGDHKAQVALAALYDAWTPKT
jgi:ankyrin repeat protein